MVIIIGAHSSSGKTLMSQNLLEKYFIPYYSVDHLKMGVYRSREDCGFTPTDTNDLIGRKLWPMIKAIIMTSIENNQNLIIEGCYILPHFLNELEQKYKEHVIPVYFGFSEDYVKNKFESNIIGFRSIIELRSFPEERSKESFIQEHNIFKSLCNENRIKYFEIEKNYNEEITDIYDYIDEQMIEIKSLDFIHGNDN